VDVKIYTRRLCAFCTAATHLLDEKQISYEEIDVTADPTTRRWLVAVTGRMTVPQIFINGLPIGGYRELRAMDRSGALDERRAR
jgi:glutaredoxin 3